jgi:endonuclease YncB( thermonuclease family)
MRPLPPLAGIATALLAAALAGTAAPRPEPAHAGDPAAWRIIEVYDGDTITVELPELPPALRRVGLRLAGIDAPELGARARCRAELALARRARAFVAARLAGTRVEIRPLGWDKYGGRIDVLIFVDGVSLADQIVAAGLARRYSGTGPRAGWCA